MKKIFKFNTKAENVTEIMKKVVYTIVAVAIIVSSTFTGELTQVNASSVDDKQAEIDRKQEQLKDVESKKEQLDGLKDNTESYIAQLDAYVKEIYDNVDSLTKQATDKQTEIDTTQIKINDTQTKLDEQYEDMKKRIQYMYENGDNAFLDIFLNSASISEMLNKAEYINKITEYDREKLNEMEDTMAKIKEAKEALVLQKNELDGLLAEAKEERSAAEALLVSKNNELASYNNEIENSEYAIYLLEKEIEEEKIQLAELKELERKRLEALQNGTSLLMYDGGKLLWPVPGYSRISDGFGMRDVPELGWYGVMHNGIDIPAPSWTPVIASYDGIVITSKYNWSLGNYCQIDHGDGYITQYAHMVQLPSVSVGQAVLKGDVIGYVGTTGSSTGNHLDFRVIIKGEFVNPLLYVTP